MEKEITYMTFTFNYNPRQHERACQEFSEDEEV